MWRGFRRHSALPTAIGLTLLVLVSGIVTFPLAVPVLGIDLAVPTPPGPYLLFLSLVYAAAVVVSSGESGASPAGMHRRGPGLP